MARAGLQGNHQRSHQHPHSALQALPHLLPKGSKTEEERQLFPLSKESMRLIGEIKQLLEEAHGSIPTVHPSRSSTSYEHLKPEQYLFQWAATPDGIHGILSITAASTHQGAKA
jgi:hypothetical protein